MLAENQLRVTVKEARATLRAALCNLHTVIGRGAFDGNLLKCLIKRFFFTFFMGRLVQCVRSEYPDVCNSRLFCFK